ncbi:MAG: NAD(P)-dependent dehydrogenase (short-subunit alcohol dehydrogenase family) [Gammaproteobacteria bacterium]|jgi:NAD(P)-dependent dehydrogenase (short-subunit alcohol dehydrogenase family)
MTEVAIVTGASRGIGAATARLLAEAGYAICVNYRNEAPAAAQVVSHIEAAGGIAVAIQGDVSIPADVERLFEQTDQLLGSPSVLINNAGISSPRCKVEALDLEALHRILDVNVVGLIHCSQQAIRRMSTQHGGNGGCIVNVSSGSAYIGNPNDGVHYAVSKGAVNSFTIGLSQEVAGEGIRVNAVSPGLTRTDMPAEEKMRTLGPRIPMGRVGEADEVAQAIVWLVSDKAGYVAGANIRVAGGRP